MSLLRAAAELSASTFAASSFYVGLLTLALIGVQPGPVVEVEERPHTRYAVVVLPELVVEEAAAPTPTPAAAQPAEVAAPPAAPELVEVNPIRPPRLVPLPDRPRRELTETSAEELADASPKRRRGKKCLEPSPDIRQVSEQRYVIEKELVDLYLNDLNEAEKLAWVSWNRAPSGEIDGFVVKRVRCGGVLHTAGIRNGDVVTQINRHEVTTIPQAFKAYRKLRRRDVLELQITRDGQPLELTYELI
ncbi:PDZ domain-containing protein [Myxococcota bacterium]|nr:PDZ domain-containing protein [Myxococcota bacterium]